MSPAQNPQDWKTTIDITNDSWTHDVLRKCPDLNFPQEFFDILDKTVDAFDTEVYVTPDGKSLPDWQSNPRPSYLQDPVEEDLWTGSQGFPYRMYYVENPSFYSDPSLTKSQTIDMLVGWMKEIHEKLTEEQLIRCMMEVSSIIEES